MALDRGCDAVPQVRLYSNSHICAHCCYLMTSATQLGRHLEPLKKKWHKAWSIECLLKIKKMWQKAWSIECLLKRKRSGTRHGALNVFLFVSLKSNTVHLDQWLTSVLSNAVNKIKEKARVRREACAYYVNWMIFWKTSKFQSHPPTFVIADFSET